MTLLDRWLFRTLLQSWLVSFISVASLYIVIDLFTKLDDFLEVARQTEWPIYRVVVEFYSYQLLMIFDRLYAVMTMLAAIFSLTWLQRHNELIPFLAAGVPMRRILRPILLGTMMIIGLSVINRELILPQLADRMHLSVKDMFSDRPLQVTGSYDPSGILIEGLTAFREEQLIKHFSCTIPARLAGTLLFVNAKEARYIEPSNEPYSGGWLLTDATQVDLSNWTNPLLIEIDPGKYFLKTTWVDFKRLTRPKNWHLLASTKALYQELELEGTTHLATLSMQMHQRFTAPLMAMVLVLLAVVIVLHDHQLSLFIKMGACFVLATLFIASSFVANYLGDRELVASALAAWLPLFGFGPLCLTFLDAIQS